MNIQPVRVDSFPIDTCHVKGDKVIIHKCEIDKAIKTIKNCADPYGSADREVGRIDILENLLDIIERGKREEARIKNNRIFKELKEEFNNKK